jgi:hypothetical protein
MDIQQATRQYERWLGTHIAIVQDDLRRKHDMMASAAFPFFRATFYRWMQIWPAACGDLASAHEVLSVGDLHVENFGTWRDQEGRLVWGVNDFDEAFPLPWTNDLVRLATSASLAIEGDHLSLGRREACDAVLEGYSQGLASGGRPFVLAENHGWLRKIALGKLRDPVEFWKKLDALVTWKRRIPQDARRALEYLLPDPSLDCRIVHRVAGLGSLGRHRFVALSHWKGGHLGREAKALAPSACCLAPERIGQPRIYYRTIIDRAARVPDPFVGVRGKWIVRRLAPDCARIELASLPEDRDEATLLFSMGFETANVHLGSKNAQKAIARDLDKLPSRWLPTVTKRMVKLVMQDWKDWRAVAKP